MKKILSIFLSGLLLMLIIPIGLFNITASAESMIVNVYDTEALTTALTTVNADIVLWNNITYSSNVQILCHSIDLNGYKLTYNSAMNIENASEFVVLDSLYANSEENTGKLAVNNKVNISQGDFIIESGKIAITKGFSGKENLRILDGNISVSGYNGTNGTAGKDGSDGTRGYDNTKGSDGTNGTIGTSGGNAIKVSNLYLHKGSLTVIGGSGGNGGDGGKGGKGGSAENGTTHWGKAGGNGGNGGHAGGSGSGIIATNGIVIYGGTLTAIGGKGASGGNGGDGGNGGGGAWAISSNGNYQGGGGGNGGTAGSGGSNSHGGEAILAKTVTIYSGKVFATGGNGGSSGKGGKGGEGGSGGRAWNGNMHSDGKNGSDGYVGTFLGNGGAGINSDLTVYDGLIRATGGYGASGIGGSGYFDELHGHCIRIFGGSVFAKTGGDSFDIGGGYITQTGEPGTLEVTGGTMEFATYGRATNVSSPVFKNCVVKGEGAYQHEGIYNADGKFTIAVDQININPSDCVGYDSVTVTADVRISRTSNITTPKPKGYISFKLDDNEFATVSITDAIAADGAITAVAAVEWVAVEGTHHLSAEYVAGVNDNYTSDGIYEEVQNILPHIHKWNSEYTIDLQPTCTYPGSKSIHCILCDFQKDVTAVDVIDHNYNDLVTPPTCTSQGYTTHTCSRCGDSYVDDYIDVIAHTPSETVKENEKVAACTENGSYDSVVYCAICKGELSRETKVIEKLGHDYRSVVTPPTCTEQGYTTHTCTRCSDNYKDNYTNALGHTPGTAVKENEKAATCTANGSYDSVVYCTACGAEISRETKTITKFGHDYKSVVTAPTCTEKGYTTYTCSRCGDSYVDDYTNVLGHIPGTAVKENIKAATCIANGSYDSVVYCTTCGTELSREAKSVEKLGHDYELVVTVPTCTEQGYTTYNCSRCGDNYVSDYTASTGHTVGEWLKDLQNHWHICETCRDELDKAEHIPGDFITDIEPTTRTPGEKHKECTVCGAVLETEIIPDIHTPGDINDDGAVNNKDLTRLFKHLSNYDVDVNGMAVDVNGDGDINNKDIIRLFQHLSGCDVVIF